MASSSSNNQPPPALSGIVYRRPTPVEMTAPATPTGHAPGLVTTRGGGGAASGGIGSAGQAEGAAGGLQAGVRGLSGAITVERSVDEKSKYPDRINLDRKGLHGQLGSMFLGIWSCSSNDIYRITVNMLGLSSNIRCTGRRLVA